MKMKSLGDLYLANRLNDSVSMMANGKTVTEQPESTNQLKNIVEQSLAMLCERDGGTRSETRRRSLPLYIAAADRQKTALVGAAKALASLWKIPRRGGPKPPNKMFPQLKPTNGV